MKVDIPGQGWVIVRFGAEAQTTIHMEECAELIQAISKMRRAHAADRDDSKAHDNLVEEMADVLICMERIKEIYSSLRSVTARW